MPALPEIYLTAAICVLLMADVFFGDKNRGLAPTLTLLILAGGAVVTLFYANVQVAHAAVQRELRGRSARRAAQTIRLHEHGGGAVLFARLSASAAA